MHQWKVPASFYPTFPHLAASPALACQARPPVLICPTCPGLPSPPTHTNLPSLPCPACLTYPHLPALPALTCLPMSGCPAHPPSGAGMKCDGSEADAALLAAFRAALQLYVGYRPFHNFTKRRCVPWPLISSEKAHGRSTPSCLRPQVHECATIFTRLTP